ncbi:MAG TPA: DUF6542 domain-containing protein [Jatrophihabitans sp.]|uniref:DUF6542 domain-containing protein n=1 Tax=Jatrophihabitans sp. TaxID=1932789 RepID=UPI002DFAB26B|nr:DUF6542 domain-containing protein [Jatrophihabitans sp.]
MTRSAGPGAPADDGWGPSTAVQSGAYRSVPPARDAPRPSRDDGWSPAGPAPREQQRAQRVADRRDTRAAESYGRDGRLGYERPAVAERGAPWWLALLVLIGIAVVGGIIDTIGSFQVRGGFNIGIVAASVVAILIVKRSHMFPIVIAPPIVYSLAAVFQLYLRSGGLHDKRVVFDAAANYLVYGFPAIAAASAAVLIIAGIRMFLRK